MTLAAILSTLLFVAALVIIFTEKMHRSITAIAASADSVGAMPAW